MRKKRNADGDLVGKPEDKRQLGRPNIKITLIFTILLKKDDAKAWVDLYGSACGQMVGSYEQGIEPPASTTAENFLTSFFKKYFAQRSQSVSQSVFNQNT
jgi:hypothetical protein